MKLYIKIYFNSEGPLPLEIISKLKEMGFIPMFGQFDFEKEFNSEAEYNEIVSQLYNLLKGTKAIFRMNTKVE
jgi:hypothetical protein